MAGGGGGGWGVGVGGAFIFVVEAYLLYMGLAGPYPGVFCVAVVVGGGGGGEGGGGGWCKRVMGERLADMSRRRALG